MSEDHSYLKFFITEQIYPLADHEPRSGAEQGVLPTAEISLSAKDEIKTVAEPIVELRKEVNPTKPLLVIYHYKDTVALPVPLKKLMLKIMEAVGMDVHSADYINECHKPLPDSLDDYHSVLVFSNTPGVDLIDSATYEIHQQNKTRILISNELGDLDQNIDLKRKLWSKLKEMFPKE